MPSISFSLEVENVGVRVCLRKKNGCVGSVVNNKSYEHLLFQQVVTESTVRLKESVSVS